MIIAAGGGERDVAVDGAILTGMPGAEKSRHVSQRTADERSAPHAVSRAAFQPARRQYLDRARRHRFVAHVHGRRIRGLRRRAHRHWRASRPAKATSRSSAAPTTASAKTCSCCTRRGGYNLKAPFHPVWDRAPQGRLRARLARRISGAGKQRPCQGAQRQADCPAVDRAGRTRATAVPAAITGALDRMWDKLRANGPIDDNHAAFISGATGAEPATGEERAFWPSTRPFRCAPPAPILAMDLNHSLR